MDDNIIGYHFRDREREFYERQVEFERELDQERFEAQRSIFYIWLKKIWPPIKCVRFFCIFRMAALATPLSPLSFEAAMAMGQTGRFLSPTARPRHQSKPSDILNQNQDEEDWCWNRERQHQNRPETPRVP